MVVRDLNSSDGEAIYAMTGIRQLDFFRLLEIYFGTTGTFMLMDDWNTIQDARLDCAELGVRRGGCQRLQT